MIDVSSHDKKTSVCPDCGHEQCDRCPVDYVENFQESTGKTFREPGRVTCCRCGNMPEPIAGEVDPTFILERLDRYLDRNGDHAWRVAEALRMFGRSGIAILHYLEKRR